MPELDAEHRNQMARTLGRIRDPRDHSPLCADDNVCRYCMDEADALAPLVAGWLADAWDKGWDARNEDYWSGDANPYRGGDDG